MKIDAGGIFAVALLAVALFFVIEGRNYDDLARQVPLTVGIPISVLLIVEIGTRLLPRAFAWLERADRRQVVQLDEEVMAKAEAAMAPSENMRTALEFHAWVGAFILAIYVIGFLIAIPLFLIALLRVRLKEKLSITIVAAVVMWLVAYFGFVKLMEVPLFAGIIWG